MTEQYQQTDINLAVAGASGANIVVVPFTAMQGAGPTGPVYYMQLGTPQNLYGDRASDWSVTPGVPGVSSDTVESAKRDAYFWIAIAYLQQGPSAGRPRAFLSAFYDGVGVRGGAQSFEGNNDRNEIVVFFGGLLSGSKLSYSIAWNGNTPLTLNSSGGVALFST